MIGGFAPGDVPAGASPIEVMQAYLGVRETGPNRGPWIDETLRFCNLEPDPAKNCDVPEGGYAWCCSSAVWCCHKGGFERVPRTASVQHLWEQMADQRTDEPEVGDLFVQRHKNGGWHIGFVTSVSPMIIGTLSGNTNAAGSREGNCVGFHDKPRQDILGFVKLRKEVMG